MLSFCTNPISRGRITRRMFFAAGPVGAALNDAAFGLKPGARMTNAASAMAASARVVSTLSDHFPRHAYIADNRFTAAAGCPGAHVSRGLRFGTLPGQLARAARAGILSGGSCRGDPVVTAAPAAPPPSMRRQQMMRFS